MKSFYLTGVLPLVAMFSSPVYACPTASCCPPWRCGISNGVSATGIRADVEAAIGKAQAAADNASTSKKPNAEAAERPSKLSSVSLESTAVEGLAVR